MTQPIEGKIGVGGGIRKVSTLFTRPEGATCLLVLAHGAGTDMRHRSMEATAEALADAGVATFRFNFPYKEQGGWRTDPPPVATATVRAAVSAAHAAAPDLPLLAGGRSFGGRMTSTAASQEPLPGVAGLVFYGFPLHNAGKPSTDRAAHLERVTVPVLFLQGGNDALANLSLLEPVVAGLGERAALHVFQGADHSFKTPKRLGVTEEQVLREAGRLVAAFASRVGRVPSPASSAGKAVGTKRWSASLRRSDR